LSGIASYTCGDKHAETNKIKMLENADLEYTEQKIGWGKITMSLCTQTLIDLSGRAGEE